jgi:uncharacterized protein
MSTPTLSETVHFCRSLREHGLAVTPAEAVAAVETLNLIDRNDRDEVFLALRSVLTARSEDFPVFAELFETFWDRVPERTVAPQAPRGGDAARTRLARSEQTRKGLAFFLEHWTTVQGTETEPVNLPVASEIEATAAKNFSQFRADELHEITRLARRLVRRLARNPSRRWRPVNRGPRIHLRRSLRQSLKTGGQIVVLARRRRKQKRTRLVVICDVSGSMDLYSRLLLQFVYGLQNSFARVETFVFSTALCRITGDLRNKTYPRALERLATGVRGWSGGTRIGASLAEFNTQWVRLVDRRTIVIVLSDGWDTGDAAQLGAALAQLQKRAGRLIWLNPLLGSPSYQPLTQGMQAALPFINVFAPAHDLASLRALEPHLVL